VSVERLTASVDTNGAAPADPPKPRYRLMTAEQVAELIAVPPTWVYQEARADRIPHVRLGRYVRFRPEAIRASSSSRRTAPGERSADSARLGVERRIGLKVRGATVLKQVVEARSLMSEAADGWQQLDRDEYDVIRPEYVVGSHGSGELPPFPGLDGPL
jgi:excisionase family DNA binding protein